MIKYVVNYVFRLFMKIGFILVIGLFSLSAPVLHKKYIRKYVGEKVVMIRGDKSGGTGFFVKAPSGQVYIMTNQHICNLKNDKNEVTVYTEDKVYGIQRKVIEEYTRHDLCLVESIPGYEGLKLAKRSADKKTVAIVGHPKLYPLVISLGEHIGNTTIRISYDVKNKKECDGEFIEGDPRLEFFGLGSRCIRSLYSNMLHAYTRGGNSGSPVVNFYGDVVGVLYAGNRQDQFDSYSVPLTYLLDLLKNK